MLMNILNKRMIERMIIYIIKKEQVIPTVYQILHNTILK